MLHMLPPRDGTCWYCGTAARLTVDHIVPKSAHGPRKLWNLARVCMPCNKLKADHIIVELDLLHAHFTRLRGRGVMKVYPPAAVLKYISTQLAALRAGKPFRTMGRGRHRNVP